MSHRAPIPTTLMASRFIEALINWARREAAKSRPIALPSGVPDPDELQRVVLAIVRSRAGA